MSKPIDEIIRIYKNGSDRIIGLHCISLIEHREVVPSHIPGHVSSTRFKRTIEMQSDFTRFNLQMNESRIIVKVQMIGGYDDFQYNLSSNDIETITYYGNDEVDDKTISLVEFPTIGDSL